MNKKYIIIIISFFFAFSCSSVEKNKTNLILPSSAIKTPVKSNTNISTNKPSKIILPNKYAYFSMGIIEENKGRFLNAIYYLKKAYEIDKDAEIAKEISSCYLQNNQPKQAEDYISQAIKLNPKNIDYRLIRVNILLLQQKNEEAIAELKKSTMILVPFIRI